MREKPRARLVAYGVAVLATGVSLLIRLPLVPWFGYHAEVMTFFPAIILSAYLGGLGPGLLATFLGAAAGDYFFLEPRYSFAIDSPGTAYGLGLFVLAGTVISGLMESLHRSRRRIAASERRYAVTLASIGDAVIATDTRARVTFLNPAAEVLTGWPSADAAGRSLAEVFRIVNEQTRQAAEDPAAKVLRLGTVVGLANHTALLARDGRETPIDDCGAPIIDDRGRIAGVVLVFRDVSQRRQAEEAAVFRRANERMELAVRGSNVGVWDIDMPDGDYRTGRRHYMNIWEQFGFESPPEGWRDGPREPPRDDPSRFAGTAAGASRPPSEIAAVQIHPDDAGRVAEAIRRYLTGETAEYETEARFRCLDGSYRTMLARGVAVRDATGKPIRFIGTLLDITRLKLTEEALRESEQRWRSLTEALPQLVWSATADGACDYFSTQWTEHTGAAEAELLGWRWLQTLHPEDREPTRQFWLESVAGRHPYDVEYRVRRRDGEYRWFKTRGVPIRENGGNIVKWFGTCTDITDLRQAEEAVRRAKEAAEAANRAKDEFLANVSHEIRTPMNAILGMTELALDTTLTDGQRQCLTTVKSAADNLLGIINDLLDFAKIEAGKLELDLADFSLRAAVRDTLRALAVRAHDKGLELIYQVQPDVPDALVGDAGRLRQVLLNLVGNAIKFTNEGEVVVRVTSEIGPTGPSGPIPAVLVHFEVSDTGIGIPRDQQDRIFRAFEQEDTSTTRKYGGTGLGLTIASRLVALMDGQITVESDPGRGSTFAFTARFGRCLDQPEPAASRQPVLPHDLRVLIVDDNATNRHILGEWLRGWRMESAAVGDALAALDALRDAVSAGRPYGLVLLDACMPDTDGLALAAKIRKRAELSATRIILLTSGDHPGDWDRIRELQIDAHLLKPVQQDELLKTIYRVIGRRSGDAPSAAQPIGEEVLTRASAAVPLRVLVAEDNDFSAQLLEQLLGRRGHQVRLASNGREALSLAGEGGFDLLLLDVHMPELDGFQVVQAVREHERAAGSHLPVIALTARSRKEDRERCLAAGMDDFLAKPVQAADLWAAIDRVVAARRLGDHAGPGLLAPQVLLAGCGGDAVILEKICQAFRTCLPDQLKAVQDALRDRDAPRLREAAHKLAGMVAAFSTVAGGVASELEDRAAQGQLEGAQPLVERLEAMGEELIGLVGGLSLEALRDQAGGAAEPVRTAATGPNPAQPAAKRDSWHSR